MKKVILIIAAISSLSALANNKAIYGVDSRIDINDSKNPIHQELGKSVAAMIPTFVTYTSLDSTSFYELNLQDTSKVCSHERFSHQHSISSCTGFLIAPDLLVTAGHCMRSVEECEGSKWVFDYKLKTESEKLVGDVPNSSVYSCKRIVSAKLTLFSKKDWSIVELDRPVKDRAPLKMSNAVPVRGDELFVIGTPSGLPLKVATGSVRLTRRNYFRTNLDTFSGNSGSPVFNTKTNEVQGILVRGDTDYDLGPLGCTTTSRYDENKGKGEDVSYVKEIQKFLSL